ncbi:MAG: BMP family ABC transporter substrate-binding protein [Thermostichales cyanobacterium BF4_bins_65]
MSSGFSRRQFVQALLIGGAGLSVKVAGGCAPRGQQTATSTPSAATPLVVGFIYVGPKDDFGYNQGHALGAAGMAANLSNVQLVEEASVPETTAVAESMRSMIEVEKATVLFPTSFGYFDPHILNMAKEFPEVQFFHAGGLYQEGVHPKNVGSYFGYIDEAQYVAGIVAGHMTKSNKLGFVAAKPIPQVLRNINSYTLAARSVKPEITTQVIFTGDWAEPIKEAEATNSMIDQGIDVITCHVDSPKVVMETAERRGIFCTGYHTNQAALAPNGYLTGAEWDWTTFYTRLVGDIQAGKTLMNGDIPHMLRGGIKDGFCKVSPYGPAVTEEAKAAADAALKGLMEGTLVIYKGELKDNQGNVVIPAGTELAQTDPVLEKMDYLVEGVIGSVS